MSRSLSTLFALSLVAFFAPFGYSQSTTTTALTIAAAADLANLEPELATSFRNSEPGLSVRFVTASSGILAQQIQNGAPYDVFLSANAAYVQQLADKGKLRPDSVIAYAVGRVALLWKDGKSHPVTDLTQSWVRFVAIANPKLAPYGAAAVESLQHAGVWKQVESKIVYGENVEQALQLFQSGNADAVLTANALVANKHPDLIPDFWHKPILQEAGAVAASPNHDAADQFLIFLKGPAAQKIFAQYGFGVPPPQTPAP